MKLQDLVELKYGKGIGREKRNDAGKYPIYGANGILEYTDESLAAGEAVIIGRKGSAGEVSRVSGKFWPSDVTYYVFGNEQVDIDYLYYFFKAIDLRKLARGVKPGINRNDVYDLKIPLPPLAEQKLIVERLEKQFAKIDEAIHLREQSLAATAALLPATLHEIFEEFDIPASDLGSVGKFVVGGTPSRGKHEYWSGPIPWVSSGELNSIFLSDTSEGITQSGLDNSNAKLLPEQSLMIGMYDTAALKMSICTKPVTTNQAIISLLPSDQFVPEFIYYQLILLRPKVMLERSGVRQQNLNSKKIKAIKIKLPSLIEQKRIVKKLDTLSTQIRQLRTLQTTQLANLKSLKQSILHEVFTYEPQRT